MSTAKEMKEMSGDLLIELVAYKTSKWKSKTKEACCLYHSEQTPSFRYHSAKMSFHCFGCGKTMDIFRYIMDFELGISENDKGSFVKAAQWLADRLGVDYEKPGSNITPAYSPNRNPDPEKKPEFNLKSKTGREYAMPGLEEESVSVELVEYLDTRGISEKTITHFGVTGNSKRMWFNIRDEKGVLRNCKGRNLGDFNEKSKRGFTQTKNAKPALFGMNQIKAFEKLYITEGEIDAMSLFECGIANVVSIPAGSSNNGWIETCWSWLEKFKEIVVWGDMDEAGEKFRREACKRLGEERCQYIEYKCPSPDLKDANGVLMKAGVKKVTDILEKYCRRYPIEGGIYMSDIQDVDDTDYSQNIPTGIYGIDEMLIDPRLGQTVLVSGREGTGKSTLLSQISLNAVAEGRKVMMYSGEMPAHRVKQWLFCQAAQNHMYTRAVELKYDRVSHFPKKGMVGFIEKYVNQNFILFDNGMLAKEECPKILDIMERFVVKHGVQVLIIDNLLTSDFHRYGAPGNQNGQETGFLKALVNLALRLNVLIYVVAHPRKRGAGASTVIDSDEIGGSGNKKNLVQTTLYLHRDEDDESLSYCSVLKNREFGTRGVVKLHFDPRTKQYICARKGVADKYPWVLEYEMKLQEMKEQVKRNGKLGGM